MFPHEVPVTVLELAIFGGPCQDVVRKEVSTPDGNHESYQLLLFKVWSFGGIASTLLERVATVA